MLDFHSMVAAIRANLVKLDTHSTYVDPRQKTLIADSLIVLNDMDYKIDHPDDPVSPVLFNLSAFMRILMDKYYFMVKSKNLGYKLKGCEATVQAFGDPQVLDFLVHKYLRAAIDSQPPEGAVDVSVIANGGICAIIISAPGWIIEESSIVGPPKGAEITVDVVQGKWSSRLQISLPSGFTARPALTVA